MKYKETIAIILFGIINIFLAYLITAPLNIKDVVLFQSYTAIDYTITYEVIIWFILSFIEAFTYEKVIKKDEAN